MLATKENVAKFEERRAELEAKAAEQLAAAEARAAKLAELDNVVITANAGEEGKLFGSIGAGDIADAITAAGAEVAKSEVKLPEGALRNTGEFELNIQLHTDVMACRSAQDRHDATRDGRAPQGCYQRVDLWLDPVEPQLEQIIIRLADVVDQLLPCLSDTIPHVHGDWLDLVSRRAVVPDQGLVAQ